MVKRQNSHYPLKQVVLLSGIRFVRIRYNEVIEYVCYLNWDFEISLVHWIIYCISQLYCYSIKERRLKYIYLFTARIYLAYVELLLMKINCPLKIKGNGFIEFLVTLYLRSTVKSQFSEWPQVSTFWFLKLRLYAKSRLFNVKFHFCHNILFLKWRLYVKARFVKSRLYCTLYF